MEYLPLTIAACFLFTVVGVAGWIVGMFLQREKIADVCGYGWLISGIVFCILTVIYLHSLGPDRVARARSPPGWLFFAGRR